MAYMPQHQWLEFGPGSLTARLPLPTAAAVRGKLPKFGLSGIPQLSAEYCASGWSLINPVAWLGGCAAEDAAHLYEKIQYGTIPDPHNLPSPPTPNVPAVDDQRSVGVIPPGITPEQWAAWSADTRAAIAAAVANGTYNPDGNLPFTASGFDQFWNDYGTYVILGGLGLAALAAFKFLKR